jgi:hypothetical protein
MLRRWSVLTLVYLLPVAQSAATAEQAPTFFVQATADPFYAAERGGSNVPTRGPAINVRPLAGMITLLPADALLTVLGGVSATRYAITHSSDADSVFGLVNLSKSIAGHRFALAFIAANSRDPTFATGVAKTFDTTAAVSREVALTNGWTLTPQLKAARRQADADVLQRWTLAASAELSRSAFGGTLTLGSGYDWLDYSADARHDDKWSVSANWMMDVNANVQIGIKAEASVTKSNVPGMSVDTFEAGPTLRVLFSR